ncbi:MAG: M20/M25/M40 family metallo-hydrolase, partial [Arenimonas sp.]
MNHLALLAFATLALVSAGDDALASSPADPVEKAIVAHVGNDHERALALLKESVDINSGTMNIAGVRKVGSVFEREFKALGFNTHWIDGSSFNRAGHLVASHGKLGPRVLLIGHLDTVFAEDSPFQKFMAIDANSARGPGTTDMKGGNVIMVSALRALRS